MPQFIVEYSTPFGPVTFTVTYDEMGKVVEAPDSATGLSPVMLKLTFGERAERAVAYFESFRQNVHYQLEVLPYLASSIPKYDAVHGYFAAHLPTGSVSPFGSFWLNNSRIQGALFEVGERADSVLQRMVGSRHRWVPKASPTELRELEPWVLTLFSLVDFGELHLVWKLLGALGTATAADRLLSELERTGTHPRGAAILSGLRDCFNPDRDGQRLLGLSERSVYQKELARPYLVLVAQISSDRAVSVGQRILEGNVEAAPEALLIFNHNKVADPIAILEAAFWAAEPFFVVIRYIEIFREYAPADRQLTLEDINTKLAERRFTETAPVVWQQQLPGTWKQLLDRTPSAERIGLLCRLVRASSPRVIYNGLLQLNYAVQTDPGTLPDARTLDRLRELVAHRYDKVAAAAIAVIRKLLPSMPDPAALNASLMAVSKKPGFRVAKLMLLRKLGSDPVIAAAQKEYYTALLSEELSPDEQLLTNSIIKYLKLASRTSGNGHS